MFTVRPLPQFMDWLEGGSKRTQARDIERAKALAKALKDDTVTDRKARHGQDDPG